MAGCQISAALDGWQIALNTHTQNHAGAEHYCERIEYAPFDSMPAHALLLASPPCTGHSKSRGAEAPRHAFARDAALHIVRAVDAHRPRVFIVENVREMLAWSRYGEWAASLRALGYALTETVLNAADVGVPQERIRLFVVGVQGRHAIAPEVVAVPHVAARSVIDMSSGKWRPWSEYVPHSRARIESAISKQGSECLIPYFKSKSSWAGRSLDRPIGTLMTKDRYVVVCGDVARVLTAEEQLALAGFPSSYRMCGNRSQRVHQIGNCVPPPLAAAVIRSVLSQLGMA